MFITGIGTAAPPQTYKQSECWEALQNSPQFAQLVPRSRAILKKVLTGNNGIETRHFVMDSLHEVFEASPDVLQARFAKGAPMIATQAARHALQDSGDAPETIDALIISTCTGYLCPGLTSYVSEALGLRSDALLLDLVGQGCGAAVPNLQTGATLIDAKKCRRVLSVCVEICSAAFYIDNDPGVLVSACLFGDGAGAAVLSDAPNAGKRAVKWNRSRTILSAKDRDLLRFEHKNGMLRNILKLDVPEMASEFAERVLNETLSEASVSRNEVKSWILHAGGRDVLTALRERLGLAENDVRFSAGVLREFGNISSPCVYFVLQAALADGMPGGWWWLSSFGAGFSCHGALLEVN